jgi:hypothetical protein
MKTTFATIAFSILTIATISCGRGKTHSYDRGDTGKANDKKNENTNCISTLIVKPFDSPFPTVCPNLSIKVNRIYSESPKDKIEIQRNNNPYSYSVGDSFPLSSNQENSWAYVKTINTDSNYATLRIQCNCQ